MEKIYIPSISASYVELKVYNIRYSDDDFTPMFTVIAPDTLVAVEAFAYLHPGRDILNVVCCGPCVALYPTFPPNK